jgi:hypothetical protein
VHVSPISVATERYYGAPVRRVGIALSYNVTTAHLRAGVGIALSHNVTAAHLRAGVGIALSYNVTAAHQ